MPRQSSTSKWAKVTLFGSTVLLVLSLVTLAAIKAHDYHKHQHDEHHRGMMGQHHQHHEHGRHHEHPGGKPHGCHAHHHFIAIAIVVALTGIAASYSENKRLVRAFLVGIFVLELIVIAGATVATHRKIEACRVQATKEVIAVEEFDVSDGKGHNARVITARDVGQAVDKHQEDHCVRHVKTAMLFGGLSVVLVLWSMMCCGMGLHSSIRRQEEESQGSGAEAVECQRLAAPHAVGTVVVKAASDVEMPQQDKHTTTIVVAAVMPQTHE